MADRMTEVNELLSRAREELKNDVDEKKYIYVGPGAERTYGVGSTQLRFIVAILRDEEDYATHYLELEHPDSEEPKTIVVKVLTKKDTSRNEIWLHRSRILRAWLDAQIVPNT